MRKLVVWLFLLIALVSCSKSKVANTPGAPAEPTPSSTAIVADVGPQASETRAAWPLEHLVEINSDSVHGLVELAVLEGHEGAIVFLDFHPDSRFLASSGVEGIVHLWDLSSGMQIASFVHKAEAMGVSFHPDGTSLATGGSDKLVRVWDMHTGAQIHQYEGHAWGILDVDYSPDGTFIAASGHDETIRLWDAQSEEEIFVLRGHYDVTFSIDFSPDGAILATGCWDRRVILWDVESGEEITRLVGNEDGVSTVAFSPDSALLAVCGGGIVKEDNAVRLFDTSTWQEISILDDHPSAIVGCGFSTKGDLFLVRLEAGGLWIWDHAAGQKILELDVPPAGPPAMAIDPQGRLLAIGDQTGAIHIYGINR